MDYFPLEFVRATEAAALESARFMGRGDEKAADYAAVEALRRHLNMIQFNGRIVIGEGERDQAPMLYIGEKVGNGNGPKWDIAVDPLEGTTICAQGGYNSISVMAIAEEGQFLHAPNTYMKKIVVGPDAKGVIELNAPTLENLKNIARVKKCEVKDLTVVILDRPRHADLIAEVRGSGARIFLIGDGDVSAAISTCKKDSGIDVLLGIGGAPEGVIAAAAVRCMGGDFQGQLVFQTDIERRRARGMGITNLEHIYKLNELAAGNVMLCATGVTQGTYLKGVRYFKGGAFTHSVVMRSETGTIRFVEAEHHFERQI